MYQFTHRTNDKPGSMTNQSVPQGPQHVLGLHPGRGNAPMFTRPHSKVRHRYHLFLKDKLDARPLLQPQSHLPERWKSPPSTSHSVLISSDSYYQTMLLCFICTLYL